MIELSALLAIQGTAHAFEAGAFALEGHMLDMPVIRQS